MPVPAAITYRVRPALENGFNHFSRCIPRYYTFYPSHCAVRQAAVTDPPGVVVMPALARLFKPSPNLNFGKLFNRYKISIMARIFITGSADGLGLMAASELIKQGHQVVLHARNEKRANDALAQVPGAEAAMAADLSSIEETKRLAAEVNQLGKFDAIIHNAGVYQVLAGAKGAEGLPLILAVNTIAPYILTCLIHRPRRLIYLSSGMHSSGDISLKGLQGDQPKITYSDSKLHDLILAKTAAAKWTDVYANAVDPGWVPTKMGGAAAPDDLKQGYQTQVWLAVSKDPKALVTGRYFHHQREAGHQLKADDVHIQEHLLGLCERISGVHFPQN